MWTQTFPPTWIPDDQDTLDAWQRMPPKAREIRWGKEAPKETEGEDA